MTTLLLHDVEVGGRRVDVLAAGPVIAAIEPAGSLRGAGTVIEGAGGALLPGLHDHHIHLLALAAARHSVAAGTDIGAAIQEAHGREPRGWWLRVVGYDEVAHGPLDRWRLDALAPGRPVRVQHRSGAMWVLSSAALDEVGAPAAADDGIEREFDGRPTGRLFRLDGWLRTRLPAPPPPDLAAVGRRLASYGITGVTDCTASTDAADLDALAGAVRAGELPFTVMTTGAPPLAEIDPAAPLRRGPVKIVIADDALPSLDQLVDWYGQARRAARPVAVHCVTAAALALAIAAWDDVGAVEGDRVEHASVTSPDLAAALASRGIAVVTQPGFIAARGDSYLREVEEDDQPNLYRCASLRRAGIEVGGGTDAPFGPDDPWIAVRAAIDRRTESGAVLGAEDAMEPMDALSLFLTPAERPGGAPRRVAVGAPADLCLLDRPLTAALADPSSKAVVATIRSGVPTFGG